MVGGLTLTIPGILAAVFDGVVPGAVVVPVVSRPLPASSILEEKVPRIAATQIGLAAGTLGVGGLVPLGSRRGSLGPKYTFRKLVTPAAWHCDNSCKHVLIITGVDNNTLYELRAFPGVFTESCNHFGNRWA